MFDSGGHDTLVHKLDPAHWERELGLAGDYPVSTYVQAAVPQTSPSPCLHVQAIGRVVGLLQFRTHMP